MEFVIAEIDTYQWDKTSTFRSERVLWKKLQGGV